MTEQGRSTVRRRIVAGIAALGAAATLTAVMPAPAGAATPPTPRRLVTGWGYFNSTASSALASLQANKDLFSDVSPFWFSATWNGSSAITPSYSQATRDAVLPLIKATGVPVLPSITDGMPAHRMAAVLASTTSRTVLVNQIVSTVTTQGYDGIDLDFERFAFSDGSSTWASTRPSWVAFVKQLFIALHAQGKLLSITTPPLYTPTTGYWVYDWAGIGRYVDRLRVMTYDYSVSKAGPIAPYAWVSKVAAFAVTQVAAGKVQIGVPTYGRDWRTGTTYAGVTGLCPTTAPAGSNPTQIAGFADSLATLASGRKTFTSSGAANYVATLTAPSFASPGVSFVTKPAVTWDATYKERTFATSVSFRGTRYQKVVTTGTAPIASPTVTVASTAGLVNGLSVVGAGVAAGTTVTSFNPTTKVVTLSRPTSAALSATTLTFSGAASAVCTISRRGYYDDASSAAARATLVATYHLRGIAEWTIGGEDSGQWSRLRSYATTIAPNPTAVSISVPALGTYARPFTIGTMAVSAGVPVPGASVTLSWRKSGTSAWVPLSAATTGPTGHASFARSITSSGTFRAVVTGTFDRLAGSAARSIVLRTAVAVTAPTTAVKPATRVTIAARFTPARVGQPSALQVRKGKAWVTLATRKADSLGRSSYAVRSPAKGAAVQYRVVAATYKGIVGNLGYVTIRSA
jgi:spore germination protein YaaH